MGRRNRRSGDGLLTPVAWLGEKAKNLLKRQYNDSGVPRDIVELPAPAAPATAGRDAVPDVVGHRCRVGPLQLSAASVIGLRHDRNGELREDTYAFAAGNKSCVVAVADGVGSAVNAHIAANVAACSAVAEVVKWSDNATSRWTDHCAELVRTISEAVRQVRDTRTTSHASGVKSGPPATTLAVAALRVSDDETTLNWLTCGDTAVLVLAAADRKWTWLSERQPVRTSVTAALPGTPEASLYGETALGLDDVLVLATDGVAEAIEEMPEEFAEAITVAVTEDMSAAKFATVLDFDVPGMADDRTILVVWHPGVTGVR